MRNITNWLNANKTCPNISKIGVILFKLLRELTDVSLKLKLTGKEFPTKSLKYLDIKIDENM